MWSTVCTVVRVRAEVQVFGRGLLWTLRGLQRMQRALRPGGARSSAVIHFLFRLALCLSSVIMAALKHHQPCLQIWNPKVSYLPVYSLIAYPLFLHIGPLPRDTLPSPARSAGIKVGQFYYHYTGKLLRVLCGWCCLIFLNSLTWINQRKMTFWDETMHVRF